MQKKIKLLNNNFWLLWQGQFVSVFGDAVYDIALSFFVLELTGSTAVMGTIMAFVTIPRVVMGPFSGVVVDNYDRKKLIVLADVIRGVCVLLIAYGAAKGFLKVWMIIGIAIIFGICTSIFNPAIESVFPDIVAEEKMIKYNSVYQMASMGGDCTGTIAGRKFIYNSGCIGYVFT